MQRRFLHFRSTDPGLLSRRILIRAQTLNVPGLPGNKDAAPYSLLNKHVEPSI
jgi:hypothetical protein